MSTDQIDEPEPTEPVVTTAIEPKTRSKAQASTTVRKLPPYNVVIVNDEEHTFDYVIDILMQLFAHPAPVAEALTQKIHSHGKAIVYTTHKEKAELKREQVLSCGADPRMSVSKGPLGCYIEPAENPTD